MTKKEETNYKSNKLTDGERVSSTLVKYFLFTVKCVPCLVIIVIIVIIEFLRCLIVLER
jgi:hypothetical protein